MGTTPTKLRIDFKGVDKTAGALKTMRTNIKGFAMKAGAAFAGAFAVKAILGGANDIIQKMHQISDEAGQVGTSVEFYQRFGRAFEQVGLSTELANKGLTKMRQNVSRLSDMPRNIFEQMNLDIEKFKNMGTDQMFIEIGKEISKLPNEIDRTKAAYEIFGRTGSKLTPLFREGPEAFAEGLEGVMGMMSVVSDDVVAQMSDIDDTFAIIKQQVLVDFTNALGGVGDAGEDAFGTIEVAVFNAFLKIRSFVLNTVAGMKYIKDVVKAVFTDATISDAVDELNTTVNKTAKSTDELMANFKKGLDAKKKLQVMFDGANDGAASLQKNIKTIKDSLSGLTLAGSYKAIQAQLRGSDPVPFGGRQQGQLAVAGVGAGAMNGEAILRTLQSIDKSSKSTEKNTAPLKDVKEI